MKNQGGFYDLVWAFGVVTTLLAIKKLAMAKRDEIARQAEKQALERKLDSLQKGLDSLNAKLR